MPEKQDFIKILKTATGKFSFEVRICDEDLKIEGRDNEIIHRLDIIVKKLTQTFPNPIKPPKKKYSYK
jgi:hypothetical protein